MTKNSEFDEKIMPKEEKRCFSAAFYCRHRRSPPAGLRPALLTTGHRPRPAAGWSKPLVGVLRASLPSAGLFLALQFCAEEAPLLEFLGVFPAGVHQHNLLRRVGSEQQEANKYRPAAAGPPPPSLSDAWCVYCQLDCA